MDKDYIVAIVDAPPKFILEEPLRSRFTIPKGTIIFDWSIDDGSTYGILPIEIESVRINPIGTKNVRYQRYHFMTRKEWRNSKIDQILC